jgi:cystathionine gamma-synthase
MAAMAEESDLRPETRAAQALGWVDPAVRALVPPIHPSASYERGPDGGYPGGHSYTRDQNPTYDQVEALLADLEGGAGALLFASGMAAATTVFDVLEPGSHVVAPRSMYFTIRSWLLDQGTRRGLEVDLVPAGDLAALERALRPGRTRIVWSETPANPTCEITDLAAAAKLAHDAGARLVADSTSATPVLTRPLLLGADLVMHSATKQLNGHSDVLAGALVTAQDDGFWQRIRTERGSRGAVLGPFEAWLLLRGMRTLYLRVRASSQSALAVAGWLQGQSGVRQVLYAGLPDHPGHEIARRQMDGGFGAFLSFRLKDEAAARGVANRLRVFKQATSLGSVESLVEHRASVEGPDSPVPADLLRLSIGIEHPDDLIADLAAALR